MRMENMSVTTVGFLTCRVIEIVRFLGIRREDGDLRFRR